MIKLLGDLFANNPKVLILGFGREGRSTYRTIRKYFPEMQLSIADLNVEIGNDLNILTDNRVNLYLGKEYQDSLSEFDLIIKSPGVKIDSVSADIVSKLTSQTDLFLQRYSHQTIGITGTKGKSTTSSLIKHFLDATDRNAVLLGNIGVPAFEMIGNIQDDSVIVYELSAHQLEYVRSSPHISVLLNIFPEHLDYFGSLDKYRKAKHNIYKYQTEEDTFIVHSSLLGLLPNIEHNVIVVIDADDHFGFASKKISLPLIGAHNLANIEAALHAVLEIGVNIDEAVNVLSGFKSLPHRLEFIGEFGGITYVNDSISTVPESTIAAVKSLENVETIILGGFDRGLDYKRLADFLVKSEISRFIFLGKAGDRMYELIIDRSKKLLFKAESIEDAFRIIAESSLRGGICLLSPAAASYDQFHNFEHRGDTFRNLAINM